MKYYCVEPIIFQEFMHTEQGDTIQLIQYDELKNYTDCILIITINNYDKRLSNWKGIISVL